MEKKYFAKQTVSGFKSTEDLQEWLSNHPDYKDQIKILREISGLTQEQLAKMVDLTPRSVRNIENGEAFPRISTLQRIADALNAELEISLVPKTGINIQGLTNVTGEKEIHQAAEQYEEDEEDESDLIIGEND